MVTSAQLRAARSLLNWTVRDLAEKAKVHRNTITRAETEANGQGHAVAQLVRTLETAGVIFIEENGEGPGVRLRKAAQPKAEEPSDVALDLQIADREIEIEAMPEHPEPSPAAALAKMDKAMAENDLIAMKNKRTRRKNLK